jgi:peroxiredoxin
MKYGICALAIGLITFASCSSEEQSHKVVLEIANANGQVVTFNAAGNAGSMILDSAVVGNNGKAILEIPALPLDFYQLSLGGDKFCALAIDSMDQLHMKLDANSFGEPLEIQGSANTSKLHEWYGVMRKMEQEQKDIKQRIGENPEDRTIIDDYNKLNEDHYELTKTFIKDNEGYAVVLAAINKMNFQRERELFKSAISSLETKMGRSVYYQQISGQLKRAEEQEAARAAQEAEMERLANLIPIGEPAPDFSQATPDGKELSLSDLRGKVVLLDFWASWCRPCRMENPNVVRMYNKYKNKGFDILSVSLDKNQGKWTQAIEKDRMTWHHVSDLNGWNNVVAKQYGVMSVPHTILVDKDGNVIAKNLRGAALESKLAEIFGA